MMYKVTSTFYESVVVIEVVVKKCFCSNCIFLSNGAFSVAFTKPSVGMRNLVR